MRFGSRQIKAEVAAGVVAMAATRDKTRRRATARGRVSPRANLHHRAKGSPRDSLRRRAKLSHRAHSRPSRHRKIR